jgi:hypothetical protein
VNASILQRYAEAPRLCVPKMMKAAKDPLLCSELHEVVLTLSGGFATELVAKRLALPIRHA